ncbi:MAG: aminotransferase class I/II-fold pyridoxal phosphate-dependent enzyme [Frankiaceae bacterium]|nr:aminotransferase class I/II-fold pyridoxal phosphate-dependent enzyme [Frankiaceae bacterium]
MPAGCTRAGARSRGPGRRGRGPRRTRPPPTSPAPCAGLPRRYLRSVRLVDLRSDTLTRPTEAMRAAMAAAEVGDDVYGEDPTVNALEERVAALFGHEAAVFVPSGTMGNQICLRLLCPPAEEVICDSEAHIVTYEHGSAAQHGGIQTRTVPGGLMDAATVEAELRPAGWGTVATRAVSVEQTHNRTGGAVHSLETLRGLRELTARHRVALHCDGARIWNAAVASGTELSAYGVLFDTLSVCLSKGLGAPVGSLVVTDAARAAEARVLRKRLGGGMRQVGVLAAAGAYALDHHLERLAEDHERARLIGAAVGVVPETNIVTVDLSDTSYDGPALAAAARAEGVLISVIGPRKARLVTHLDIDDEAAKTAADVMTRLVGV